MDSQNQRNLLLALVLTALLLFGWDAATRYFYPNANKPKPVASASAVPGATPSDAPKATREGGLTSAADIAAEARDLKTALADPRRVPIEAPGLAGNLFLVGGIIDDLSTVRHTATLNPKDGKARIFSPEGTPAQQFAQFSWSGSGIALPNRQTVWTAPAGAKLTPSSPVTLAWTNPTNQKFEITYSIDSDYMITATQSVSNGGTAPVVVKPVATLGRTDKTASLDSFNVHSGPIGAFDGAVNFETDYKESCFLFWCGEGIKKKSGVPISGQTNWIGFTDVYWMSTLIPEPAQSASTFATIDDKVYFANVFYPDSQVAPGQTTKRTTRLFAGAKEVATLDRYQASGITNFGLAIDWGWFRWFEKPIFWLLDWLFKAVGNFGVAIMLLTLIVRGLMFPIAQKQFASMAAMRAIQPKMKAIQDRYKDDKQKQQQEVMALYKKEGVNPLAGCLPIFLQIPVFFALYKVLIVAIEMRHQPFALWIKDLSAPDPLHVLNLFGALDFTVPAFLGIGVLAILLGITMYLQFKLQPAQMDPVQQQVFAIMPWMMMFIMAPFAAGLLLYWITSNVLTIGQQYYLYSKHPQLKLQAAKDAEEAKLARERPR